MAPPHASFFRIDGVGMHRAVSSRSPCAGPLHYGGATTGLFPVRMVMSENRETSPARMDEDCVMDMDRIACYRAISTRDARFDGRLFVGVKTTGIYCRPICPARTPKFANVSFYPIRGAAQEAGFRPCLRCRPETSPDLAFWRGTSQHRFPRARADRSRRRSMRRMSRASPIGSASARASCGGCSASISAPRRSRWRRRGGCCSPSN